MPTLHFPTGKTETRTMGWFFRHLFTVTRIEVTTQADADARMLAYMDGSTILDAHYNNREVLWDTLHRYTLFGTPLNWMGMETEVKPRSKGKYPWNLE